jgi:serine/threonine protein kinase
MTDQYDIKNNDAAALPIESGDDNNITAAAGFTMGLHATLTFEEVLQQGDPTHPLSERDGEPLIFPGKRDVKVRVIPAMGSDVRWEQVYLKRDTADCQQVYRRVTEKKSVDGLQHGGSVIFALRMERVQGETNLYREPREEDAQANLVAIKKQSLAKIQKALKQGHHENPFDAIKRMQTIGDDVHVLGCLEALKDHKNLHTIMKFCDGGVLSMHEDAEAMGGLPESTARECILKIWKNLHYLQRHGIVHHDLSPDNIMSLNGNLVMTDLAMSLRVPEGRYLRRLLYPQGHYGKRPYMSPEVFVNLSPFDGFGLDLWASGCLLYVLLTGHYLFYQPFPVDLLFRYFVLAKGLSNNPINERTVEVMVDVFNNEANVSDRQPLLTRAMSHIQLSATATELLENMFEVNPANRYTLSDCMQSSWAQGEERLWLNPANRPNQ